MLGDGLMMVHDTVGGGQDDVAKLPGGQDLIAPVLNLVDWDIESRRNDSALVNPSEQLNNDLSGSVVIDDLELSDVSLLLHDLEELDQHFGARPEQDLSLALSLGIDNGF